MVKIIEIKTSRRSDGSSFVSLKVIGDPEFVQSQKTGKFYLTAKSCFVATTFDEYTASDLIGRELPGIIERVASEPYEYKLESTGEVITLTHKYEYRPEANRRDHANVTEQMSLSTI